MAESVDLIVDSAALVNGVLPYCELFGPNVVGTAELIRLAITTRLKAFTYVSTADVGNQVEAGAFTEDADIRIISAHRANQGGYANGYGNSKWAGEVLLREAHDLCGLPVAVFRSGMIMADPRFTGQLNLSDTVTRMIYSVMLTGVAPGSFYQRDAAGNRQRAHFDGLPVGFVAEAVTTLGAEAEEGFVTYHVMNPHDDGIGIDEYVDWLIEAGYPIERVEDFGAVGCSASRTVCGRCRSDKLRTPCSRCCSRCAGCPGLPAAGTHARGLGFHRAVPGRGPRGPNRVRR